MNLTQNNFMSVKTCEERNSQIYCLTQDDDVVNLFKSQNLTKYIEFEPVPLTRCLIK